MINISQSIRSIALAFAAALLLAAPLRAQEASFAATPVAPAAPAAQADAAPAAGPTSAAAAVAVRRAPTETLAPVPAGVGLDRGRVLMVVGAAAILTGIVIGNDAGYAISVGGAVVGLYGLYLYLQ